VPLLRWLVAANRKGEGYIASAVDGLVPTKYQDTPDMCIAVLGLTALCGGTLSKARRARCTYIRHNAWNSITCGVLSRSRLATHPCLDVQLGNYNSVALYKRYSVHHYSSERVLAYHCARRLRLQNAKHSQKNTEKNYSSITPRTRAYCLLASILDPRPIMFTTFRNKRIS